MVSALAEVRPAQDYEDIVFDLAESPAALDAQSQEAVAGVIPEHGDPDPFPDSPQDQRVIAALSAATRRFMSLEVTTRANPENLSKVGQEVSAMTFAGVTAAERRAALFALAVDPALAEPISKQTKET